jgi:membrane protein implicated in regulation of membrane protease activity
MTPIAQLLLVDISLAAGAIGATTHVQLGNVACEFTLFIVISVVVGA